MQSAPRILSVRTSMKRISQQSRVQTAPSAASAFGPCSAINARSRLFDLADIGKMRAQVRLVGVFAGRVDDQEQMIAAIGHHQSHRECRRDHW